MSGVELERDFENRRSGCRKFDRYPLRVDRYFEEVELPSTVP
jgi:hypothetical protein